MNPITNAETAPSHGIEGRGLVPLREATAYLGLHDTRVTMRLVREGRLKARRIGRRTMLTARSLREFVEA